MDGTSPWQLCYDENTGYNYYWNIETNEVKWQITESEIFQNNRNVHQGLPVAVDTSSQQNTDKFNKKNCEDLDQNEITLITSYGGSGTDDSSSENSFDERTVFNHAAESNKRPRKRLKKKHDRSAKSKNTPTVFGPMLPPGYAYNDGSPTAAKNLPSTKKVFGPELPPDFFRSSDVDNKELTRVENNAVPSLVPYGDDDEHVNSLNNNCSSDLHKSQEQITDNDKRTVTSIVNEYSSSTENESNVDDVDEVTDNEGASEDAVFLNLKKKAITLKNSNKEVANELKNVTDESKTVEDIIAEIENELPPDHFSTNHMAGKNSKNNGSCNDVASNMNHVSSSSISLIADYGNESESEAVTNSADKENEKKKKLSSINATTVAFNAKKQAKPNMKVIKLSSRAKELIKTSMLTAKARQTNFVETEDGLKPIEEIIKPTEITKQPESESELEGDKNLKKKTKTKTEVSNKVVPEVIDTPDTCVYTCKQSSFTDGKKMLAQDEEIKLTASKKKPLFAAFADDIEKPDSKIKSSSVDYSSIWAIDRNQVMGLNSDMNEQRRKGFGFSEDDGFDKCDEESGKLHSKKLGTIQFVKSETINLHPYYDDNIGDVSNDEKPSNVANESTENANEASVDMVSCTENETEQVHSEIITTADDISSSRPQISDHEDDGSDSDMVIDENLSDVDGEEIIIGSNVTAGQVTQNLYSNKNVTIEGLTSYGSDTRAPKDDMDITDIILNGNSSEVNVDSKIVETAQLIMEKLRFLSAGTGIVSSVQIMAIQIETLMGAWYANALDLKYLEEWLEASGHQLKTIENATVPVGWVCEWDRSFRRYYYRNLSTGSVQWNFPEIGISGKQELIAENAVISKPSTVESSATTEVLEAPPAPKISSCNYYYRNMSSGGSSVQWNYTENGETESKSEYADENAAASKKQSPSENNAANDVMLDAPPAPKISCIDDGPVSSPSLQTLHKRTAVEETAATKRKRTESSSDDLEVLEKQNFPPLPASPPPEIPPPPPPPPSTECSEAPSAPLPQNPPLPHVPPPAPVNPPLPPCSPPSTPPLTQSSYTLPYLPSTSVLSSLPVNHMSIPAAAAVAAVAAATGAVPLPIDASALTAVPLNIPTVVPHSLINSSISPALSINPPLPHEQSTVTSSSGKPKFIISSASVLYGKPQSSADEENLLANDISKEIAKADDADLSNKSKISSFADKVERSSNKPNLSTALDSFYSDIASLHDVQPPHQPEKPTEDAEKTQQLNEQPPLDSKPLNNPDETQIKSNIKKKKKIKFDVGLSLKKKGLEGLVAKWQKVHSTLD